MYYKSKTTKTKLEHCHIFVSFFTTSPQTSLNSHLLLALSFILTEPITYRGYFALQILFFLLFIFYTKNYYFLQYCNATGEYGLWCRENDQSKLLIFRVKGKKESIHVACHDEVFTVFVVGFAVPV